MLENIRIKGFRKYCDFSIDGFNRINFILGDNNVGKTSVLESIFTWACGQNIVPMMNIPLARARYTGQQTQYWIMEEILSMVNNRHEIPMKMEFDGVFNGRNERFEHIIFPSELLAELNASYKNDMGNIISKNVNDIERQNILNIQLYNPVIVGTWEVKHDDNTVKTNITSPISMVNHVKPLVNAKFIDILSHTAITENVQMYASLKREGLLSEVVSRINRVFPEIESFDMIPYPDGAQAPVSVVKRDGSTLPLYACGDGVQRWFYIVGALTIYKNSILCIDEIDAGMHPCAQVDFCKNVSEYATNNNVQLFITTHNLEFVDRFLSEIIKNEKIADMVNIFTLRDNEGSIFVRNLDAKSAFKNRDEFSMELR